MKVANKMIDKQKKLESEKEEEIKKKDEEYLESIN